MGSQSADIVTGASSDIRKASLTQQLKRWFLKERRSLPWRDDPSPYAVWVSEVMLQQTQASVVIPYFERWMEKYPTIEDLAHASLDEVIKEWEGLGYYSRARNLHEGAQFVVNMYGGQLPHRPEELKKIKGLGPYTIGAIRSFAFYQKAAAVDGNVMRVIARLFMVQEDITKTRTIKKIREVTENLLPDEEPWIISEALIELGALICQRKPKCTRCPLKGTCQSFIHGVAEQLPVRSGRKKVESLFRAVAVIGYQDHLLVHRGKKGEIMHDLHEFPFFETTEGGMPEDELIQKVRQQFHLDVSIKKLLPHVRHSFTQYRVHLYPFYLSCHEPKPVRHFQWMTVKELEKFAFSSGHRRIFASCNLRYL